MLWPFRKRRQHKTFSPFMPPITKEQQRAAAERLAIEREKHVLVDFGNGPLVWKTGLIDIRDLISENGYHVVFEGYDRFGWPKGDPESPAS